MGLFDARVKESWLGSASLPGAEVVLSWPVLLAPGSQESLRLQPRTWRSLAGSLRVFRPAVGSGTQRPGPPGSQSFLGGRNS